MYRQREGAVGISPRHHAKLGGEIQVLAFERGWVGGWSFFHFFGYVVQFACCQCQRKAGYARQRLSPRRFFRRRSGCRDALPAQQESRVPEPGPAGHRRGAKIRREPEGEAQGEGR